MIILIDVNGSKSILLLYTKINSNLNLTDTNATVSKLIFKVLTEKTKDFHDFYDNLCRFKKN